MIFFFSVMLKKSENNIRTEKPLMTILAIMEMTNVTAMHSSSCVTHVFWSFKYLVFIFGILLAGADSDLLLQAPIRWLYFHVKFKKGSCLKSVFASYLLIPFWISLA